MLLTVPIRHKSYGTDLDRVRVTLTLTLHRRSSRLGLSHAQNYPRTFGLHKIFKCAYLKFMVYGRKHTHNFPNAVTLVWGSLRLTPIRLWMVYASKPSVDLICWLSPQLLWLDTPERPGKTGYMYRLYVQKLLNYYKFLSLKHTWSIHGNNLLFTW